MNEAAIIEAMARAMCREACVDPDAMTYPGILMVMQNSNEQYTLAPEGWQLENAAPAWHRFTDPAKAARAAIAMIE